MDIKSALKTTCSVIWRITFCVFLLSLPVTIFPLIAGIEGAVTFYTWNRNQVQRNVDLLLVEADRWNFLNYYNVPNSESSIQDFLDQRPPFYIPKLTTVDWLEKLGLEHPLEFDGTRDGSVGIDKMAALRGLVRDVTSPRYLVSKKEREMKTNYWIYVTDMPEFWAEPWDQAFDELLRKFYVSPLPDETGIYYLDCGLSGFLCGVWDVKAPSLIHFQVADRSLVELESEFETLQEQDEDVSHLEWMVDLIDANYTYESSSDVLYPAIIRVVELPLVDETAASLLPRNTLPTPRLQLETVLDDPDQNTLLSRFDHYNENVQNLHRFYDYHNLLSEQRGTVRYHFSELDKWWSDTMIEPIFGNDFIGNYGFMSLVQNTAFTTCILIGKPVLAVIDFVWSIYAWYMGLAWDGLPENQAVVADMYSEEPNGEGGQGLPLGNNFMSDMFAGFMKFLRQNVSAEMSEKLAEAAITES